LNGTADRAISLIVFDAAAVRVSLMSTYWIPIDFDEVGRVLGRVSGYLEVRFDFDYMHLSELMAEACLKAKVS